MRPVLQSDEIAALTGASYKLHYCKGDYFSINNVKKGTVNKLVYPVPETNHVGLGVHLTIDLSGRMKLGPDATYVDRVEDYSINGNKRDNYYASAVSSCRFFAKKTLFLICRVSDRSFRDTVKVSEIL